MSKLAITSTFAVILSGIAAIGSFALEAGWFSKEPNKEDISIPSQVSTKGDNSPVVIGTKGSVTITDQSGNN